MKNENTIFYIIGVVILVTLILSQLNLQKQEFATIGVHYYKNGVEIIPQKGLFSIVTPPGGSYDQISLSISGSTGDTPFSNIQITDASPLVFKNALPTTIQSLTSGQSKTLWTSELMDTAQFESLSQPVRFSVDISAVNDYTGEVIFKSDYVDLTIEAELNWFYVEDADNYSLVGSWTNGANTYDGDWNTYGQASGISYVYIDYIKPIGAAQSSVWQTKHYYGGQNIDFPFSEFSSCWNYDDILHLRIKSDSVNKYSFWECEGSLGWYTMFITYEEPTRIYEEAMNWEVAL